MIGYQEIIHIKAPARICLFGDHQDYLGLPVIACAIDRYIELIANPSKDKALYIHMLDIGEARIIQIGEPIEVLSNTDFFASAIKVLERFGCIPERGYDITIKGNIPINAGLSSSSAVLVAWVAFLLEAFGANEKTTLELIAKICYTAEVLEFNGPGGLMDQYSISLGNTIFLDTVTGNHTTISNEVASLIIGESGVPKETLEILRHLGDYAKKAIRQVKEKFPEFDISKSTLSDYNKYADLVDEKLQPIFYAALKNYEITKEAFKVMQQELIDINRIGELMDAHHKELKEHLKITVPIIDAMIEGAKRGGALGAKIVGSGGGGCIVAIARPGEEQNVINGILAGGASAAYKINIGKGVQVL
ncbi:MAG: galactokinase family protein [Flavobacteriaceae bacterium]